MLKFISYNTMINFHGLSLDKTDHVIQNQTIVIRGYPQSDLISYPLSDFILMQEKPRNKEKFKLNFSLVLEK